MSITERATVAVFGLLLASVFGVLLAWVFLVISGTNDKGNTGASAEKIESSESAQFQSGSHGLTSCA